MNISKTLLFFFFIQAGISGSFAQASSSTKPDLVFFQDQTKKWKEAYNSGDGQNLVALYTTDARYISSHVAGLELTGRDRVIANFQNGIKTGGHIDSIEIISMIADKNLVTLLCKYQATNSGQTVTGRNLLVLKKVNGTWLIAIHMTVV